MKKEAFQLTAQEVRIPASALPSPVVTYSVAEGVWILEQDYVYDHSDYRITIAAGFRFDLASIPRMFWWLIAPFELSIAAPLIHDFLYESAGVPPAGALTPPRNFTRAEVDHLFLEIMEKERVPGWRRTIAYDAVRLFGGGAWGHASKPVATPGQAPA